VTTGVFLSLTISCKMNGLFTFMTIGTAVAIDLWNLLDHRRGLSNDHVLRHFMARVYGLIVIPALVYLFWFWVHFAILTKSGPGDDFMSPAFQQTLQNSPMALNSQDVFYFDRMLIQHKGTKAFLHSHPDKYPLKYPDGRISSQGQQVTGYTFEDTNNEWVIMPAEEGVDRTEERPVKNNDVVRLHHPNSDSMLLTHDVASPTMPTNTEFTVVPVDQRYNDTLFRLEIVDGKEGQTLRSKSGHFKLIHVETGVALWTHAEPLLPDWAHKQQEVNGNKNPADKTNIWFVESIVTDPSGARM
jgi:dolichyl-phosphate-mannose-protein mannosyltransferase